VWTDLKKIILYSRGLKSQPVRAACNYGYRLPVRAACNYGYRFHQFLSSKLGLISTWKPSCRGKKRKAWPQLQADRLCLRVARLLHERDTNYWAHKKASFACRFYVDWCSVQWRRPDHLSFDVWIHGETKENLEGDADLVDCSAGSSSVHSLQYSRRVGSNSRFVLH